MPKVCEKSNQTNPIASIPTNEILLLNTFELKNKDLIKGVASFVVIKFKYVTYPVILRYIFAFSHKFALRSSCWHHYKCASRLVRVIQHCRVCASQEGIGIALLDLPCSFGRYIQREVTWRLYNRAVAAAPLPTFAVKPQKFPQTPGASLNSVRLRGTFPLGLPEYIRQTALSCVRGPDRALRRSAA